MTSKNVELNNSEFNGNLIQGGENITANTKATSNGKSCNNTFNNDLREATVGTLANTLSDNATQQANQYVKITNQEKTLAEALQEIQQLLKQLEVNYPTATQDEKIAYLSDETSASFKRRLVSGLQAAGEASLKQFLDNPYVNITLETIKGWSQAK
ncbi:hypothetical protein [Okeania sp. SIO3I5]|uniref:hypothetical protein n=1 Tax=Okeania sp. SIO3I5 TaxID=2607805 RepID=UPI0025F4BC24|nr:hypothetical protein [Okeania sp. SIO3I5]